MADLKEILKRTQEIEKEIIDWRRQFHKYPELMFQEHRTSETIYNILSSLGLEVWTGLAETGLVSIIRGGTPGKVAAIRADMDALPITENTGLPFSSENEGVMHACGHDAHMAMALGAAKTLCEISDDLPGTVKMIFQPAEEGGGGGKKMVEEGALEDPHVDAIFALHVQPGLLTGTIGILPEIAFASADNFEVTFKGPGGHAAHPEKTKDPILAASSFVSSIQSVISRRVSPLESAVVTVASIHGGSSYNIIPSEVKLLGTIRCLNEQIRFFVRDLVQKYASTIAETYELEYHFLCEDGYPLLICNREMNELVARVCKRMFGNEKVVEQKPTMGAEDFAYYLQKTKGTMFRLGVSQKPDRFVPMLHTDRFNIDERALVYGTAALAGIAMEYLTAG